MRKLVFVSLAAIALAGAGVAEFAVAAPGDTQDSQGMDHSGWRAEMRAVMFDARLAGMKAALKLTPDQEKAWGPFETAVRAADKAHMDAMREMRERAEKGERPSPIDRMNAISDRLAKASTELKQVADAAKPLYDSLDDTQKREFGPLLLTLRERPGMGGEHMGMGHMGMGHMGMDQDDDRGQ